MLADGWDGDPVPATFEAVTRKVYAVPLLRPVTSHDNTLAPVAQVRPPGDAVTV
jgi:hypothetical protein